MANGDHGAGVIAALTAMIAAAGAALAAALPRLRDAAQARHAAQLERIRSERDAARERYALAQAMGGSIDNWTEDHPLLRIHDSSREAWAVVDEGAYLWANARFCDLLGFDPGELAGQPWAERVAPESAAEVRAARDVVMGGSDIGPLPVRMVRRTGETINVSAWSTPGPGAQLIRLETRR